MFKSTRLYFLLLLTLIFFISFTGNKRNSNSISKEKAAYTSNVEILTGLAEKVYLQYPERSLQYAQTALEIARKNKDLVLEEKVLVLIGKIYMQSEFHRLAIPYIHMAISIDQEINNAALLAGNYNTLGEIYYKMDFSDSAAKYFNQGFNIYFSLDDKAGMAKSTIWLGNTYWYKAGYDKALELYLKALQLNEEIKNKKGIGEVNTNIGALYTLLGDYPKALIYLRRALSNLDRFENTEQISNLYFRYGDTYQKMKQFDSALYYFKAAKILFDTLHNIRKSGFIDQSMGSIYDQSGKTDKAIVFAKKAMEKFEKQNFRYGIASIYNDLANYYIKTEDFTNSLNFLNKGLKLSKELKSIELLKSYYLTYSQFYKINESFAKALYYHELYSQMNDSVLNQEKNIRIAELQTKYETNKSIQELAAKTEENNRNLEQIKRQRRNLYISGLGIIIILAMSIGLFWQYRLLQNREIRIKEINKDLDNRVKERTAALQLTQFSIEHAADSIFWLNKEGNFIFANLAACANIEFTKEEFNNKSITELIPKFTIEEWWDFWNIIKTEGSLVTEIFLKKKNQLIFPVELTLNYISHEGNEYAFAFIRDISDRKQKEENLRKAKEKAEEADKLKSAFLANMSHEIRTPMNAILGFSDLLINEGLSTEDKLEFASIIKNSADTLLKLIDDIIDISLIDAGQLKMNNVNFQLNNTLKEIIRFYQEEKIRLQKSHLEIRLNESYFNDQIALFTDPVRFRQIVTNLVGNAIKFTDNGYIEVGYVKGSDKVKIYVKDTGIGIPTEKIPTVFERFRKHNSNNKLYGGTGLGLAISKKMVEQMGGTIFAASEVGKGSIFWFTIPFKLSNEFLNTKISIHTKNNLFTWRNKSLLIVEDVESNYLFLETILKNTEIDIFWAKDGSEALNFCKTKQPDAVLMDIQLPKMDGYNVTREILTIYPEIPIIAQTAYAFSNEKEKIMEAGFKDYLSKPIDSHLLLDTLNKYIG